MVLKRLSRPRRDAEGEPSRRTSVVSRALVAETNKAADSVPGAPDAPDAQLASLPANPAACGERMLR
jgi:hypothetical protein